MNNNNNSILKTIGWCPLLWYFYQRITPDLRVKEINKNTIDISNETLVEMFGIFQIANGQFDYFFIYIKAEFFLTIQKGMDQVVIIVIL